jgi:hypothetical protein
MDVVVLVLAGMSAEVIPGPLDVPSDLLVLMSGPLLVEFVLVLREHVLLVLPSDSGSNGVDMLGVKLLLMLDRLNAMLSHG